MRTTRIVIVAGVLLVLLVVAALPATGSMPASAAQAQPSPRPPITPTAVTEADESDHEDDLLRRSAIVGTVSDLSTGRPGAGIGVSVSGFPAVRTDARGAYSVSGLGSGEYAVSVVESGAVTAAGSPIVAYLDGRTTVTVDLTYYSQPPPAATPTATASLPTTLPETGGAFPYGPIVIVGLLFIGGGLLIRPVATLAGRDSRQADG